MHDDDDWADMTALWRDTDTPPGAPAPSAAAFARRQTRERLRADVRLAGAIATIPLILAMAYLRVLPADVAAATFVFAIVGVGATLWSRRDPAAGLGMPRAVLADEVRRTRRHLRWALAGLAVTVAAVPYVMFVLVRRDLWGDRTLTVAAGLLIAGGMLVYGRAAARSRTRLRILSGRAAELEHDRPTE